MLQEFAAGINMDDLHVQMVGKGFHHLLRLVEAQQAVIHKHAGQLVADGPMDQCRRHRGIHPAGQPQDHFVVADLRFDFLHRLADVVRHVPVLRATANVVHEAVQHCLALRGMGHLGMELQCVKVPRFVRHTGNGRGGIAGDHRETRRQCRHFVAVTHPHIDQAVTFVIGAILNVVQQGGMTLCTNLRVAEFAH